MYGGIKKKLNQKENNHKEHKETELETEVVKHDLEKKTDTASKS